MFAVIPNRVAPYLNEPKKSLPPMPATREGREAVLTDAVFAAIAALQGLLTHHDPKVVMRAAEMILNLETTRQRHGRAMIGMESHRECTPHPSGAVDPKPHPEGAEYIPDDLPDEPDDALIEVVRSGLQEDADEKGTGEKVTWAKAKQAARDGLAFLRQQACGTHPAAHAAATTAAVSTRSTRGPNDRGRHPAAVAAATSSALNPPSGPIARATP